MRSHTTIIAAFAVLALSAPSLARGAEPANIVFVLADDLGWTDLGCQGSRYYETPHIDRLAAGGVRFTSFYAAQNCAPTRAALLTGQYAPRTGVYTVGTLARGREEDRKLATPENVTELPLDRTTIAQALKSSGYATAMFGKWHLGDRGAFHPSQRGFDEAVVSAGRHFDFKTVPPREVAAGAYFADWLTSEAIGFIDRHRERHPDRPFFLYLAHFAVHAPLEAKEEIRARFAEKAPSGGHRDPVYAAMLASLDESVGRITARLEELGLSQRTLVIFSSDNGGVGGYRAAGIDARENTDNAPLRAGKGTFYEGGVRVPFIARWPGVIEPGSTCDVPAAHVDLFPTLLEVARSPRPSQPLDGASLAPLFKDPRSTLARDAIYWHLPGYLEARRGWRTTPAGAIRAGEWKLLEFFEDRRVELYNLHQDIGERRDLARTMPEKARELREKLASWREALGAEVPRPRSEAR